MATVKARRLRPAGVGKQFVSIVHRGAARRVWKTLKGDTQAYPPEDAPPKKKYPPEANPDPNADPNAPPADQAVADAQPATDQPDAPPYPKKDKAMKEELQLLDRLIARKATLDDMIMSQQRKCGEAFELQLAQKGTTATAVHSLLFDESAFSEAHACAWADAHGYEVYKSELLDGARQLQVHPCEPGDREFVPVQVTKGVDAICFATPPDPAEDPVEALKVDVAGVLDSARESLLASMHTATPDVVRAFCSEVAAEIVTKMNGAAEEGADDMLTQAELAKKVDELAAAIPTAESIAEIVKKAMTPETPTPAAPEPATKADIAALIAEEIGKVTKAIDEVKAEVAEAKKTAEDLAPRIERAEKALPARNGRMPESTRTVEGEQARKSGGMFDSVMPWGRRANA